MNKLDEIFEKQNPQDGKCPQWAKNLALEFAKHILEEASYNADMIHVRNTNDYTIDKQSITDTLNKYL